MFWKYNTSSSSQLESLLAKEDVTLQEILDSDDIINECRIQNKTLIDFLLQRDVMEELVDLTTREPSSEIEEKSRYKYPNIASEILTCDVPALNERVAGDERLLDKLYEFIDCEPPLNPLLASYFSKLMGALIAKKTEQNWLSYQFTCLQVLDFLKAKDNFISLLLKHLGTSAIMDLMLKLMTQVEGVETRQNILNWLDSQRIIQSLVSMLNSKTDKERHFNVAQLLCDFIRTAREYQRHSTERADPDPLLNAIESSETVNLLLDQMLNGEKSETAIVGGIQVLLTLIDTYQTGMPKFDSMNIYNSNINDEAIDLEGKKEVFNAIEVIAARLKEFQDILLHPPTQNAVLTSVCLLDPPLGNTRLQVIKLFAAIISTNHVGVFEKIVTLETMQVLLDLFFQYPWNNFLHTQVENCLIFALKSRTTEKNIDKSDALYKHLLHNCKLIERIIEAWTENDEKQSNKTHIRQGYMGHLISIVNKIVELCSTTSLWQYLKDTIPETAEQLEKFKETTLDETNKIRDTLLGGTHPNVFIEENDDYGNIPFPQSTALQQQLFAQYQMQHLSSQCIDGYSGFNDDAFNDGDDTLQTMDQPADVNFELAEGDLVQQDEIFKQVCAQNINTLFDADEHVFDEKEHTFQTVIEQQGDRDGQASDSDDEGADDDMDLDPWTSPKTTVSPLDLPWDNATDASQFSQDATGWADFSSAKFFESSPNEEQKDLKPSVEGDLKVQNIETNSEKSVQETPLQNCESEKPLESGEKTEGIDANCNTNVVSKSAAGDQGDKVTEAKEDVASLNIGDSCEQPTEKEKPDKENV